MTAAWPPMPDAIEGDPGWDRSEWLVEADPIELMREHREMLAALTVVIDTERPWERTYVPEPLAEIIAAERARQDRAHNRTGEYDDG